MSSHALEKVYVTRTEADLIEALHGLEGEGGDRIARILSEDLDRLVEAREKHAVVGATVERAMNALSAELGEACQELEKRDAGWEWRMDAELQDVRVVALRMSLREYGGGEEAHG